MKNYKVIYFSEHACPHHRRLCFQSKPKGLRVFVVVLKKIVSEVQKQSKKLSFEISFWSKYGKINFSENACLHHLR